MQAYSNGRELRLRSGTVRVRISPPVLWKVPSSGGQLVLKTIMARETVGVRPVSLPPNCPDDVMAAVEVLKTSVFGRAGSSPALGTIAVQAFAPVQSGGAKPTGRWPC